MARLQLHKPATKAPYSPQTSNHEPNQEPNVAVAQSIVRDLFGPPERRVFAVRYWDGTIETPAGEADPRFTVILRHPGALRRMLLPPSELALGEAYLRNDFDVTGSLEEATDLAGGITGQFTSPRALASLASRLLALPATTAPEEASTRGPAQTRAAG
ncbi:MAG: hypothetical protein IVW57_16405, partial [Ktedonobacterales bacterium]|nr:hypothetical protein [Ktedonobacterales bacterium]